MSKSKIYCGIGEVPKGYRRCTPKEASELKQVRYYGLHEISERIANEYKGISSVPYHKEKKLHRMIGGLKGKKFKYEDEIKELEHEDSYNRADKKKHTDEIKELKEKLTKISEELKQTLQKKKQFNEVYGKEIKKPKKK
jgi:DNA repair exonuclease SbcCD ATPase subunit